MAEKLSSDVATNVEASRGLPPSGADAPKRHAADAPQRRKADHVSADGTFDAEAYTQAQYDAALADARNDLEQEMVGQREWKGAVRHLSVMAATLFVLLGGLWFLNGAFAPELYKRPFAEKIAEAFDNGRNFGVHDLNIDIRTLRDAHIARLDKTPEVALLGASHWQEATMKLLPGYDAYNAHIHRDYWEDPLAMIEMFERHDKLPETIILTIRDNQFTPVAARTDFLWLPGIPYYRTMAKRLGLRPHHPVETAPVQMWKDRLSMPILYSNMRRSFAADEHPGPTSDNRKKALDVLLPDGSIVWSEKHLNIFTQERTRRETLEFAAFKRVNPPLIDPKGVEAMEALLDHLHRKGVRVYFNYPPYNPLFWETVQGSPYMEGLAKVKALVSGWGEKYGWDVIGGFDGGKYGCTIEQYIDSEHANAQCLSGIFNEFMALHEPRRKKSKTSAPATTPAPVPADDEAPAPEATPVAQAEPVPAVRDGEAGTELAEAPRAAPRAELADGDLVEIAASRPSPEVLPALAPPLFPVPERVAVSSENGRGLSHASLRGALE